MNTEEKAQRYDEALERAKKALKVFGTNKCEGARQIFSLFPELKESEDERMKKTIIHALRGDVILNKKQATRAIDWLEKQGATSKRMISAEAKEAMYDKPTWSEADEDLLTLIEDSLSDYLEYTKEDSKLTPHSKGIVKLRVIGYIDWIKSLKQRTGG